MPQEKKGRKIVKHGPSSYIVSLPLSWIKRNNLMKGTEVILNEINNTVVISPRELATTSAIRTASFSVSEVGRLTKRLIHALYKKGIDIIIVEYNSGEQFDIVRSALGKEAIGYEIVEATDKQCVIKRITQLTREFRTVLRQVFLVTLSLADECVSAIGERNYAKLRSTTILEESNNKFTTYCRCYVNLYGAEEYSNIGPLYYVLEVMELIGNEYKYICEFLRDKPASCKLNPVILGQLAKMSDSLRAYYEYFYAPQYSLALQIQANKESVLATFGKIKKLESMEDIRLYHHVLTINKLIYSLIAPTLVLTVPVKEVSEIQKTA